MVSSDLVLDQLHQRAPHEIANVKQHPLEGSLHLYTTMIGQNHIIIIKTPLHLATIAEYCALYQSWHVERGTPHEDIICPWFTVLSQLGMPRDIPGFIPTRCSAAHVREQDGRIDELHLFISLNIVAFMSMILPSLCNIRTPASRSSSVPSKRASKYLSVR